MEHFIGRDIFAGFLDEIEFARGSNPNMEKSSIMKMYNTIKRRMESRYMKQGKLPGMLFLVSSKKSDSDFLEQYLAMNKYKPYLYIVDEPIWIIKSHLDMYSGKTFRVAVGNRYRKSKILEPNEIVPDNANQEIIEVPVEYKEAFELDINSALMDIAGKAINSSVKFIYYEKLKLAYRPYLVNPFTTNELVLGFDDETEISDFLLVDKLSKVDKTKPHFIHWDGSKNGDSTGLSMGTVLGTKEVRRLVNGEVYDDTDIIHKIEFSIKITASPGSEIPFYKIRNFIYYLKFELNYNIVIVSCDSYQSVDNLQQLKLRGFNAITLSVDRSRLPYESLKNAINEQRILIPHIPELEKELLDLEDDHTNKIDHPVDGSKDMSDTLAAIVYNTLHYKDLVDDQYASELTDSFISGNTSNDIDYDVLSEDWLLGSGGR